MRSFTYTYIVADKNTKEAVLIDPVIDTVDRDLHIISDIGLNLIYAGELTMFNHPKYGLSRSLR